jgi:hypothetical protein
MSSITNKVSFAGDVIIDEVVIISSKGFAQTVTLQVSAIDIFEDVFSTFITGKLYIRDSVELTNLLPLIGEEVVKFKIITPSLSAEHAYEGEFFIYKMEGREKTAERELIYILHFISKEAISDINVKLSKAYSGKVSSIVETLIKDSYGLGSTKKYNIEETSNQTKFVSNWWRPTQCIQFMTETAVNQNNSPSYVFFENKYGLNFVSLESLYVGSPIMQRFVWDQYTREINAASGTAVRDIDKDYQRVLVLDIPKNFDYMERASSGMYGSELITYDILTKQYTHVGYQPTDDKDIKRLNTFPLWSDSTPIHTKSLIIYGSKYYNNFEGFGDVTNSRTIQKRKSLMAAAEAHKLNITVFGRTDYSVGQRVRLSIPLSTQIKKNDDAEDKIHSGNYLISAIRHSITRESHQCNIELIKDSYLVNINDYR